MEEDIPILMETMSEEVIFLFNIYDEWRFEGEKRF